MYEDLIKRLRETSIWFGELDNVSDLLLEAANTIEELDAKYSKALQDLVKLAKNSPKVGKHGRLIDADALEAAICSRLCIRNEKYLSPEEATIVNEIYAAPTIIEAEECET